MVLSYLVWLFFLVAVSSDTVQTDSSSASSDSDTDTSSSSSESSSDSAVAVVDSESDDSSSNSIASSSSGSSSESASNSSTSGSSNSSSSSSSSDSSTADLPSSCIGLSNGEHKLKLIDSDEYPILTVKCSNEYMIIDYNTDEQWSSYFSSWTKWHYAVAGPLKNDHPNWQTWFLPDAIDTSSSMHYVVSQNCLSCDEGDQHLQKYDGQSSYYLSSLAFGCFHPTRGWPACDMDFFSYECNMCQWNEDESQITSTSRGTRTRELIGSMWKTAGVCDFEIRSSEATVTSDFKDCQTKSDLSYKPSIGLAGEYCVCSKPRDQTPQTIEVSQDEIDAVDDARRQAILKKIHDKNNQDKEVAKTSSNNLVDLYQDDFRYGTYRIVEPGTYTLQENIMLDFNSLRSDPFHNEAWRPKADQNHIYDGAQRSRGAYFQGFFAGITVECDDVTINLHQFSLAMSAEFFYSQPFFSLIELGSQPFLPQEGPGFFGSDAKFATHVVIRDGTLGLTSHHAIHGNYNSDVHLYDLQIHDFQTHGIQLNGFTHVQISNVNIGPSTSQAWLNGNFAQMRQILPTLRKIARSHAGDYITFAGREKAVSMQDLLDVLIPQLHKALDWALHGTDYSHDPEWADIFPRFVNPSGLPYGAALYGLFLNYPSAGIFGWHVNDQLSAHAVVTDVTIHGLRHSGDEILGLARGGRVFCNAFNGPLPLDSLLGLEQVETWTEAYLNGDGDEASSYSAHYVGDIITDVWLAMYYFGKDDFDNWAGIPFVGENEELIDWATDETSTYVTTEGLHEKQPKFESYCNEDAMFHPSKGILGVKISGTHVATFDNVQIYDLRDKTVLGNTRCGAKELYHFSQQSPYQIGFSMNMVHGFSADFVDQLTMNAVNVHHLYSNTGLVYGISSWFETDMTFSTSLAVTNLHAGIELRDNSLAYSDRPNKAPEACAVRVYGTDEFPATTYFSDILKKDIVQTCIVGSVGCFGDSEVYSSIGEKLSDASEVGITCEVAPDSYMKIESVDNADDIALKRRQERRKKKRLAGTALLVRVVTAPATYALLFLVLVAVIYCVRRCYMGRKKAGFAYNLIQPVADETESDVSSSLMQNNTPYETF